MKIPRGATLHRFKTGGWRFEWGRILLWRTSTRYSTLAEYSITRTKTEFWLDLCFLHLHIEMGGKTMNDNERKRIAVTIDRLLSNIPAACKVLLEEGYVSLAGQLGRDCDNLAYWQEHGGLIARGEADANSN